VNSLSIISLSLPTELLEELDAILGKDHSAISSEVKRQAVRMYLSEYNELDKIKRNVIATVTFADTRSSQPSDFSSHLDWKKNSRWLAG
jgi:metal-responsive CopG/Arc/MetJ family transcriptional regulator